MSDLLRQIVVEAITFDEAAYRCRVTRETFARYYDGPVVPIGREKRVMVEHLNDWLTRRAGIAAPANQPWGAFDDLA